MSSSPDQFLDRIIPVHQVLRAAGGIEERSVFGVDAEVVIKRGEDRAEMDGAVGGLAAGAVSGADDLTGAHAAAGDDGLHDPWPVVAAAVDVDTRGAAELAPGDDRHVIEHPALA